MDREEILEPQNVATGCQFRHLPEKRDYGTSNSGCYSQKKTGNQYIRGGMYWGQLARSQEIFNSLKFRISKFEKLWVHA